MRLKRWVASCGIREQQELIRITTRTRGELPARAAENNGEKHLMAEQDKPIREALQGTRFHPANRLTLPEARVYSQDLETGVPKISNS